MNSTSVEVNLQCPIHEITYMGICSTQTCPNGNLICSKCNKEPCIESHTIIPVEEFFNQFFARSKSSYDFKKFAEILQKQKNINRHNLATDFTTFQLLVQNMFDNKFNAFYKNVIKRLESFKQTMLNKLDNLQKDYLTAENRIDLSSFEIPENFTLEETKKFFEKNNKSIKDMENMINLVKKYSDNEKLATNQKDMETIIYSKNLIDVNTKELLEEKFNTILKEIKEKLKVITSSVLLSKDKTVLLMVGGSKKFTSDPKELKYKKDITDKCQKSYTIDSVFTAFTTLEGKQFVAWGTSAFVIEVYDLTTDAIVNTLSGHTQHIYIVRHFRKTSLDYLLSTSYERNCKVWDLKNNVCAATVSSCHSGYYLYSALIIFDDLKESTPYIVTTAPNEYTKVWDFKGNHVKDIAAVSDYTYYINTWYDNKNSKIYIVNANSTDIKIYDFRTGSLFRAFKAESVTWHMSAFVHDISEVPHLFETDGNGHMRIWNVNTGAIFKDIHVSGCNLRGLCLWNDQYVMAASSDKSFKIFDIQSGAYTSISGHDNVLCTIEKIEHPNLGECLLTSAIDGKIKLWTSK
jgi:WD40 repeat protein